MSLPSFEIPGYKLIRPIGSGGMATVYLAVQESLGRDVAIKVMRSNLDADPTLEERFLREGQNLARLTHHHIASIYDIAKTDDCSYFAMELLEAGSLSDKMKEGLSLTAAMNVVMQIGSALDAAHRIGIVHRDLKPSNILFRDPATPVLTDFGIAKDTQSATKLTNTGMMVGTPSYMSPEQIMGREIDGRSDLYSLGVVFYEMLVGSLPFEADEAIALAMKHIYEPVPPLAEEMGELQPIIDTVMAKNPDDRYESVGGFCYALKQIIDQSPDMQLRMSGETMLFKSSDFRAPSISGSTSGPGRATPSLRTPTGSAMPPPPPLSSRTSGSQSATTVSSPAPLAWIRRLSRKHWLGLGAIAAVAVIGLAVFMITRPRLDPETQKLVDVLMVDADRQVSDRRYTEPPGNNAFESITEIYKRAPDYAPARQLAQEVANSLEARARIALANNNIDQAQELLTMGEQFQPDHEGLAAARSLLDSALADRDRIRTVAALQRQAGSLIEQGQLTNADGSAAIDKINQALALDPGNTELELLRQTVRTTLLEQIEQLLVADDLDTTEVQLGLAKQAFPVSPGFDQLSQRLAEKLATRDRAAQVASLMVQATDLFRDQNYYAEGSGALGLFRKVLQLDPDNSQANQALVVISAHYLAEARKLEQAQDYPDALGQLEIGLLANPTSEELLALQTQIEQVVRARDQRVADAIEQARELIANNRIITPADRNALTVLAAALQEAPDSPTALELNASLPTEVGRQINLLLDANEFAQATALAGLANRSFPTEDFARLPDLIEQRKVAFEQGQQLQNLLGQGRSALGEVTMNRLTFQGAAAALRKANTLEPDNQQAQQLFAQLLGKASQQVTALVTLDSLADADAYIDEIEAVDANYSELANLRQLIVDRQAAQAEAERQRFAAMSLPINLDARPWGQLVSLSNLAGKAVELPADVVTPLSLRLLPGSYKAAFEHPNYPAPVAVEFVVGREQDNQIIAVFELLKAKDYFAGIKF